jgi:hypothetical protein
MFFVSKDVLVNVWRDLGDVRLQEEKGVSWDAVYLRQDLLKVNCDD